MPGNTWPATACRAQRYSAHRACARVHQANPRRSGGASQAVSDHRVAARNRSDRLRLRAIGALADIRPLDQRKVFRSEKDGGDGTCRFIKNVAAATGAGLTTITDFNDDIPQTSWAFSLQMTPDVVEVVRLLDMMKQDLAIRSTTKEFLLILFAAFRSRTPTKLWAWKNCGQSL